MAFLLGCFQLQEAVGRSRPALGGLGSGVGPRNTFLGATGFVSAGPEPPNPPVLRGNTRDRENQRPVWLSQ